MMLFSSALPPYLHYRCTAPEPPPKKLLFPRFGSKFRYSGRTHFQTRSSVISRTQPSFDRTLSCRTINNSTRSIKPSEYTRMVIFKYRLIHIFIHTHTHYVYIHIYIHVCLSVLGLYMHFFGISYMVVVVACYGLSMDSSIGGTGY